MIHGEKIRIGNGKIEEKNYRHLLRKSRTKMEAHGIHEGNINDIHGNRFRKENMLFLLIPTFSAFGFLFFVRIFIP